jgi:DNA polymerase-1
MPTPEADLELWEYNAKDCVNTREVGEVLASTIDKLGLAEVDAFQQRLFYPVLQAMIHGVRVDLAARRRLDAELESEIKKRLDYFAFVLGHPINVDSPKQMCTLFYTDLGQQPIMSKATKASPAHVTCNDDALVKIARREPILRPLIQAMQEYRTLRVMLSTFVRMELDYDNRMRCSYNIAGTETYRFNSKKNAFNTGGNLQNMSGDKGEEDEDAEHDNEALSHLNLPNCRKMLVPDPGFTFFDTDLSKADLRIVVWESGCTEMKRMLAEGFDPYVEAAREYFRDPTIKKALPNGSANPKYTQFKSLSHGTHYLGTPQGLASRLALLIIEVERVQKWYFGRFPEIRQWQIDFCKRVTSQRKVSNKFGYVRQYFDRVDDALLRKAIAWVPQSTVACLINRVWLKVHDNLPEVRVLLQTHDSLSGQYPTAQADKLEPLLLEQAKIVIPYDEPLIIPIGLKKSLTSWGDCS